MKLWRNIREWFNPLLRFDRVKFASNLYARNVYGDVRAEFPFTFLKEVALHCNRGIFLAWNVVAFDNDIRTMRRPYSIVELCYMELTDWLPI